MSSGFIRTSHEDDIYHVVIARAPKRNALTIDMIDELGAAVRAADLHPGVRAVILSGDGAMFSAGIDVSSLMAGRVEAGDMNLGRWLRRMAERMQDALNTIENTELPVIAALHGQVIGLGLELALACDLRVCGEGCTLSMPEARMGLVADVGGTTRLSRLVDPGRAKDMLMTARTVGADEALLWGLVNRVAPEGAHLQVALELARQIAQNAPLAVGMAKLIVDQGDGAAKATQLAIERWAQSLLISTDDVAEAMTAFMEKRPAEFKGK